MTCKIFTATCLIALLCTAVLRAADNDKTELRIPSKLGQGFGKVFLTRGKIVKPPPPAKGERKPKIRPGPSLLVTTIEGKALKEPVEVDFGGYTAELEKQLAEFPPDREFEFALYETIRASGNPDGLGKYPELILSDTEWHVSTVAVVVKIR